MQSKYYLLGVIFLFVSCSHSQNEKNSIIEKWYKEENSTRVLTKEIHWADNIKEKKSSEIEYRSNGQTVTSYSLSGLKSRVDVFLGKSLVFQSKYEYDRYGNLSKIVVINDSDTTIVKYTNNVRDSLIQSSVLYTSEKNGEEVGAVRYKYTDTSMTVTVLTNNTEHSSEIYYYDNKGRTERYEKYEAGDYRLIDYTYTQKGRKLLLKVTKNNNPTEKWEYLYNEKGDLKGAYKWTPNSTEKYIIEYN